MSLSGSLRTAFFTVLQDSAKPEARVGQFAQSGIEASADGLAGDDAGDLALVVDVFARVLHAGDVRRQASAWRRRFRFR